MQTVKKTLAELHKTTKNIRRHSERQIAEYIRSLQMFGQIRPLVVTEDGEILVGNGMYEALTQMGAQDCDCYVVEGLTEAEKRKLMLADNKVYELGFTDIGVLDDILADLGGDLDVPGYDSDLLATLTMATGDVATEVLSYGADKPEVASPRQDAVVTAQEAGASPYAPPVRTSDGGFANPTAPVTENKPEAEGKYIICPHCGEKIWL